MRSRLTLPACLAAGMLIAPAAEARLGGGNHAFGGGGFHRPAGGFNRAGGGGVGGRFAGQAPHGPGGHAHAGQFQPGQFRANHGGGQFAAQHPNFHGAGGRPAGRRPQLTHAGQPPRQRMARHNEIRGGNHVTINSGNVAVAGRGRPLPPPPMPYPAYVGGPGWDVGAAIVGGLAIGATAGLVAGAVANSAPPPAVVVEAPPPAVVVEAPPPVPPAPAPQESIRQGSAPVASARSSAGQARFSAGQAQQAAGQAQQAAEAAEQAARQAQNAAAPPVRQANAAPVPPGARYALGTRFAQPPEGCAPVAIGPINFDRCGGDWLQPIMQGGAVTWIAVPAPQG